MICPMMSYQKPMYEGVQCEKDNCRWWVDYDVPGKNRVEGCAMARIAYEMAERNGKL